MRPLLISLLLALALSRSGLAFETSDHSFRLVEVVSGFFQITDIQRAPGEATVLYVAERNGQIWRIENGQADAEPFIDVSEQLSTIGSERGLLGFAFSPNWQSDGRLFLNFTGSDGATRLVRVDWPQASITDLLTIDEPFSNHNSGHLAFGPSGYLYMTTGDGGAANDPGCRAQDSGNLLGKTLRLDVNGGEPYRIPPDNPFLGDQSVPDEIWSVGWRNPWGLSFDSATGDLWIADVGQAEIEEIDLEPAGTAGGRNYGWSRMEGNRCNIDSSCGEEVPACFDSRYTPPILTYDHSEGCSVTGGAVYRGHRSPVLDGLYLFSDFCVGTIWAAEGAQGGFDRHHFMSTGRAISTFGVDSDGEILIADYFGGAVYRIEAALTALEPGDADGDGQLLALDLSWLIRLVAGTEDGAAGDGDCNGETGIGSDDLVCALSTIFGSSA